MTKACAGMPSTARLNIMMHMISLLSTSLLSTFSNFMCMGDKPGLRTHQTLKTSVRLQPYLPFARDAPVCNMIVPIWTSSHALAIERGHHIRRVTPVQETLCKSWDIIKDNTHFILSCHLTPNCMINLCSNIEFCVINLEIYFKLNRFFIYLLMNNDECWH